MRRALLALATGAFASCFVVGSRVEKGLVLNGDDCLITGNGPMSYKGRINYGNNDTRPWSVFIMSREHGLSSHTSVLSSR